MRIKAVKPFRFFCACMLLLCMLLPGVPAEEAPELLEPVGVMVDTAKAYIGEISKMDVYDGSVIPYVEGLYFQVEGVVDEVNVAVGQKVKKGDVLVTLDQEAQAEQIKALKRRLEEIAANEAYDEALAQIDRDILSIELQALMDQKPRDEQAIALKKLEIEEFELDVNLQADLREMEVARLTEELLVIEEEAGQKVLTAPFDGRVLFMEKIDRTSYAGAYAPLIYLADDTQLTVETELISQAALKRAHSLYALIGSERYDVEQIVMDEQEYMSKVLAGEKLMSEFSVLDMGAEVHAGMYAAICVITDYVGDALLVPANAVYSDSTGDYVYLINGDTRERRDVELGVETKWLAQILEGIEEGDEVYVKE